MEASQMSGGQSGGDDALWPKANEALFINLMYEEVVKGNTVGCRFTPSQWIELMVKMGQACLDHAYTAKQLEGKSDRIRLRWKKYHRLLTCETGFVWDEENNLVTGSEECWARWLAANPQDAFLRRKGLPHYRQLTTIYALSIVTGRYARSSSQRTRVDSGGEGQTPLNLGLEDLDLHERPEPSPILISQTPTTKTGGPSNGRPPRHKGPVPAVVSAMNAFTRANDAFARKHNPHRLTSVEKTINILNEMGDMSITQYLAVAKPLEDPVRRRMFLAMDVEHQRGYVDSIQE